MTKLIKNELYKIFHKKFVYVMAILIVLMKILTDVIVATDFDIDLSMIYEPSVEALENDTTNLTKDDLQYLVADKNQYDGLQLLKENHYSSNSWQAYVIINGIINQNISCMNESKYISKDDEQYESCKKDLDTNMEHVKDGDWEYFVKTNLEEAKKMKALLEMKDEVPIADSEDLEEEEDSLEIDSEEEEIDISYLNRQIEENEYRLKYGVPYGYSVKSSIITTYTNYSGMWDSVQHDESKINKYEDLVEKREIEKEYEEAKYKLENGVLPKNDHLVSSQQYLINSFSYASFFMILFIIVLGATIVADEFNKGTIKQLLLKPFTRTKILISKYLSCLVVFFIFIAGIMVVYSLIDGIAFGFEDLFLPVVSYSHHVGKIVEYNTYVYVILNFISILPHYLILFTLGFLISILLENSVVGIIVPLVIDTFGGLIMELLPKSLARVSAILPFNCWELNNFLFGRIPSNEYASFGLALFVDVLLIVVMLLLSILLFKKKDIKNQ